MNAPDSSTTKSGLLPGTTDPGEGHEEDTPEEVGPNAEPALEFENLLSYLKYSRGFDFLGYKRASLMRRVDKQMQAVGVTRYGDYIDYLEVHPDEFERLFNTILINVTAFFRDITTWDYLADEIVPRLLAAKPGDGPIRLWSAGCASGQEAYSLTMILAEKMGVEAFRRRVKIYATDVDEEALAQARSGAYTAREVHGIPPPLLEKYFDLEGDRYVFHKDLRRALIFGRHDLLRDAPISRVDLLTCRNALMYFNAEVQAQILARFHFGVSDGGYLCLGKAEMLFSHANLFLPLDLKRRVFVKAAQSGLRDRMLLITRAGGEPLGALTSDALRLRDSVFQSGPVAQIVVDRGGLLTMANERALTLFRLNGRDLSRPLQDLEISYRPVELRSLIEQVTAGRRPVSVKDVAYTPPGSEPIFLNVSLVPLQESGTLLGTGVSFSDVTRARHLSEELQEASRALETAYEELQSSNEELETTNEELQSTVEELETTNEELQSTNEELETTNEELQSTNEELQTINEELRVRSGELDHVNVFLESILGSLRGSVIVLDGDLQVQIWNGRSQDLWGLRPEEAEGKAFLTLDIGLPVEALVPAIRACLTDQSGQRELTLQARNRRGRAIACRVRLTRLPGVEGAAHGILLVVEEQAPNGHVEPAAEPEVGPVAEPMAESVSRA